MRHKIISISKAKAELLQIAREVAGEGRAYLLTKDGEAIGALIPMEDYEAFLETDEILSSPEAMRNLEKALDQERAGRTWVRDRGGRWTRTQKRKKAA